MKASTAGRATAERERNQAEQAEWSGYNVGEDEDRVAALGLDVWGEDSAPVAGGSPSPLVLLRTRRRKDSWPGGALVARGGRAADTAEGGP